MDYHSIRGNAEKDNNDCTVIAVAVTTGISYEEAQTGLGILGRRRNHGCNSQIYHSLIRQIGFNIDRIRVASKTVRTVERELAEKWGGCKVLINVRGHVLAWDGAKVVDWSAGRGHRIRDCYLIYKGDTQPVGKSVPQPVQKDLNRGGWTTTAVEVRCIDLGMHNWKCYKSLPAAYKANGWRPQGRQAARKWLKRYGAHDFPVYPEDRWSGVWVEARVKK